MKIKNKLTVTRGERGKGKRITGGKKGKRKVEEQIEDSWARIRGELTVGLRGTG